MSKNKTKTCTVMSAVSFTQCTMVNMNTQKSQGQMNT